ncbi:MAG: hypothetical protein IJW51_00355 [Clostridia bacterium]|nr:hypothetical protein [Clostridia bacterium]
MVDLDLFALPKTAKHMVGFILPYFALLCKGFFEFFSRTGKKEAFFIKEISKFD